MPKTKKSPLEMPVGGRDAEESLQNFLSGRCHVSKRSAKNLLDGRRVWVNNRCVWMARHVLHKGDIVRVIPDRSRSGRALDLQTRVLDRADGYVVINKPAGILTCGPPGSIEALLRLEWKDDEWKAAHRLDRETSGCLLFVRGNQAFDATVRMFKTHRVQKTYHAIVFGNFRRETSTVALPLDGDRAVTRLRCLAHNDDASFLEVRIETGRTHQVRRHLAALRHPVLGDREHGLKKTPDSRYTAVPRLMLHASELALPNPLDPETPLRARAPLPPDFHRCLSLFALEKRR